MWTQPLQIVSERAVIAIRDFDKLYGKVMKKLQENNLQCEGGLVALYHCDEFDPESTDVEVGAVMAAKSSLTCTLPGGACVMGVHLGAYSGLPGSVCDAGEMDRGKGLSHYGAAVREIP